MSIWPPSFHSILKCRPVRPVNDNWCKNPPRPGFKRYIMMFGKLVQAVHLWRINQQTGQGMDGRGKLTGIALVVLVGAFGGVWAMMPGDKPAPECTSCTARHMSLQKLQRARSAQSSLIPGADQRARQDDPEEN